LKIDTIALYIAMCMKHQIKFILSYDEPKLSMETEINKDKQTFCTKKTFNYDSSKHLTDKVLNIFLGLNFRETN